MQDTIIIYDSKNTILTPLFPSSSIPLHIDFSSETFNDILVKIEEIYQEQDVLGETLQLQHIVFLNTSIESTNVFQQYLSMEPKGMLVDVEINDPSLNSWTPLKNFIQHCKDTFTLDSFSILDINHLIYFEDWKNVIDKISQQLDLQNSYMKLNTLNTFATPEMRTALNRHAKWLEYILTNFLGFPNYQWLDLFVDRNKIESINAVEQSDNFDLGSYTPVQYSSSSSLRKSVNHQINLIIIPLVDQTNDIKFSEFIKRLNTQYYCAVLFVHDEETLESFSVKYQNVIDSYADGFGGDASLGAQYEMFMGIYCRPYWNDVATPKKEIRLSNQFQTIPLDVTDTTQINAGLFANIIGMVRNIHPQISKLYFEFFNMTQNYNQSLDIIFTQLSQNVIFNGFVGFYYSYIHHLEMYHPIWNLNTNNNDNTDNNYNNDTIINVIYYDNGTKQYNWNESTHNIDKFLNSSDSASSEVYYRGAFIEYTKIHNIVLIDKELGQDDIDQVGYSLTPNTLLLPFDANMDTYELMKEKLRNLSIEPHINLKNVSLFQHHDERNGSFSFLSDENSTIIDVSVNDAELNTWTKFIDFMMFLDTELNVNNFDMLLCKIYSDPNWRYVIDHMESNVISGGMNIRSSDDNTGHVMFDGDWILESETVDVNMIRLYFTEKILDVEIVLANLGNAMTILLSSDKQSFYFAGQSFDETMTFSWSPRPTSAYFSKVPLYGNTVNANFNILDEDEYVTTYSYRDGIVFATSKNKVYGMGKNDKYSLGVGIANENDVQVPTAAVFQDGDVLATKTVKQITSTNGARFYILMTDGTVYAAGNSARNLTQPHSSGWLDKYRQVFNVSPLQSGEYYIHLMGLGNEGLMLLTSNNRILSVGRCGNAQTARGINNSKSNVTLGAVQYQDALSTGEQIIQMVDCGNPCFYTNLGNIYAVSGNGAGLITSNNLTTIYTKFVRTDVSQIQGNILRMWGVGGAAIVYTDQNKYFVRGNAGGGQHLNVFLNSTNNAIVWTQAQKDIYTDLNNSHIRDCVRRNGITIVTEKSEVFSSGGTGRWLYGDGGTNSDAQLFLTVPTRPYTSSVSSPENYLVDVAYGPIYNERVYYSDNANVAQMFDPPASASTSIPISYINNYNDISSIDANSAQILNFNVGADFNPDTLLAVSTGIYKITNIPSSAPLALLNNGQESFIKYTGSVLESTTIAPDGNTYSFYSGTILIEVFGEFTTPISFYTTANGGSYLGTQDKVTFEANIVFDTIDTVVENATSPIIASDVSYLINYYKDVSSNYFALLQETDEISGTIYRNYNFTVYGNISLTNILETFPIAVVEISSNDLTISGDITKKSVHSISGTNYDFYYGGIDIGAQYGFHTVKLYVYNALDSTVHELQNQIVFNPVNVSIDQGAASVVELPFSSYYQFYKLPDTGDVLVRLNELNELSGNFYDTHGMVEPGIYEIKNIPERYPLGILDSQSRLLGISYDEIDSSVNVYDIGGGVNVNFYNGTIYIHVSDNSFSDVSFYVYNTASSSANELSNFVQSVDSIQVNSKVCMTLNVPENFESFGPYTVLNVDPSFSLQTYNQGLDFGVYKNQTYVIRAPVDYPLAIVSSYGNVDISYSGYPENQDGTVTVNGVAYPLYTGPVFFTINSDLSDDNTITFYTKSGYDLNTMNMMVYDTQCKMTVNLVDEQNKIVDKGDIVASMIYVNDYNESIYTLNSGTRGHRVNKTLRNTDTLVYEHTNITSELIGTPHNGSGGLKYSQYFNSFVFLDETQAGTWNFGLRATDDNFCSLFILEGNYCWEDNIRYDANSIPIIDQTATWSGTAVQDGVATKTMDEFLDYVNTNFPNAKITKLIEIDQANSAQVNGQFTFEANKPYTCLIYWRHNTTAYGTANISLRFGYWAEGDSVPSLPAEGVGSALDYSVGDIVPEFFYSTINFDSVPTLDNNYTGIIPYLYDNATPNQVTDTFYLNTRVQVYPGQQITLREIPPWYPITVLNNGSSSLVSITGDASKNVVADVSGVSYSFYYGDICLNILSNFSDISGFSLYSSYGGGTRVGLDNIVYIKNELEPLLQIANVNILTDGSGNTIYGFNNKQYSPGLNYQYGAYIGTYLLRNIPETHALAVLNAGFEDQIKYTGSELKGTYTAPDGNEYSFYFGTVTMTIKDLSGVVDSSFSICRFDGEYLGGEGVLKILDNNYYNVMNADVSYGVYKVGTDGFPSGVIDFNYQPFDYTLPGMENFYLRSATLVNNNLKVNGGAYNVNFVADFNSNMFNVKLRFNDTSALVNMGTNNAAIIYMNEGDLNTIQYSTANATASKATLDSLYDYYMYGGPIGASEITYFEDDDGNPIYNSDNSLKSFYGNQKTNQFSHIFALSTDAELTENSILFPGHFVWNGNNHNPAGWTMPTLFQDNDTSVLSTSLRHYDWNESIRAFDFAANFPPDGRVYLYALEFGPPLSKIVDLDPFPPVSYFDPSSGVVVEIANPETPVINGVSNNNEGVNTQTKYTYFNECLQYDSSVNVIEDASLGKIVHLNSNTEYSPLKIYAVYDGSYQLTGITDPSNAIAIHNKDISNVLTYTGETLVGTKTSIYDPSVSYEFYSGSVTITISGEFDDVILLETYDTSLSDTAPTKLMYSTLCNLSYYVIDSTGEVSDNSGVDVSNEEPAIVIKSTCLKTSSTFRLLYDASGVQRMVLNFGDVNSYDPDLHYGLNVGSYLITNIPETAPLAIFNYDVSNVVQYTGETRKISKINTRDKRSYDYYSGYVKLDILELPTDLSFISFGSSKDVLYEENKLYFLDTCQPDNKLFNCIKTYSKLTLETNNIIINNVNYSDNTNAKKLGIYNGYYQFTNISQENPIAFISNTHSSSILYSGLDFNKQVVNINGIDTDFYYGNVVLGIFDDFENDLKLYVVNSASGVPVFIQLYYTDYCETEGSEQTLEPVIECAENNNTFNIVFSDLKQQLVMNGDTTYTPNKIYGFNIGTYKFSNVSEEVAFRIANTNILNNDIYIEYNENYTNLIEFTKNDICYNYYYGDVYVNVTADVSYMDSGIIFDLANNGNFNAEDRWVYSNECLTDNNYYLNCLDIETDISIVDNKYVFNGNSNNDPNRKFGINIGNYILKNVPASHPIAILNHDVSGDVTYSGDISTGNIDISGINYTFYTGNVYITVKRDFSSKQQFISIYSQTNGFDAGGGDKLVFSEICDIVGPGYYIEPVSNTLTYNTFWEKIILNGESINDPKQKYGLFVGTYTITNVPETNAIALLNNGYENKIAYTGTDLKGVKQVNDVSYNFYYGTITLYVFEPFENEVNIFPPSTFFSMYSYESNDYLGLQNKFVYYDHERLNDYLSLEYTICLNQQTNTKMFQYTEGEVIDGSFNYTFNDSTNYFSYKKYGIHIGKYILKNVPISTPIAILNRDISNVITYVGSSSKKITGVAPDGNSYDYYFGDVEIECIGDFGTVSIAGWNSGYLGGENLIVFTPQCERDGYVVECLSLESSMNIIDTNFTFNNSSNYNPYKKYGLTVGSYKLTNIPQSQSLTFLNADLSSSVIVEGSPQDLCGTFVVPDGNSYDFFTNEIRITVLKEFDGFLPLYSHTDNSFNNGAELFVFSSLCQNENPKQYFKTCLKNKEEGVNRIAVDTSDPSFILLDASLSSYVLNRKYGVYLGNYVFDVDENFPIAFLNKNKEDKVLYSGEETKKIRKSGPNGEKIYDYYYGRVVLSIFDDFDKISYHILDKGYMGGKDSIVYSNYCDNVDDNKINVISCVSRTSPLSVRYDSNNNVKFVLNNIDAFIDNQNYGLHDGVYEITDICENYPIALLNNGNEEFIDYIGDENDIVGNYIASDGNSYPFYKNKIQIYVNGDFSAIEKQSLYFYNSTNPGHYGMQNKIVYTDLCEDTQTPESESINDNIVLVDFGKFQQ